MFWYIVALLIIGIVLILLESVLPFGISMIIGAAVIMFSWYLSWMMNEGKDAQLPLTVMYILISTSLAGLTVFFSMKAGIRSMTLDAPDEDAVREDDRSHWPGTGQVVEVTQTLRPTGTIRWQDERLPARTVQTEKEFRIGDKVRVCGKDSVYLLVEENREEPAVNTRPLEES
jgi:membrane-bound ClpP family serine protease